MSETHADAPQRSVSSVLVERVRGLSFRQIIRICQVMIAVHILLRAIVFGSAFFYWDDYVFQARAARLGLFSESFLMYFHNGHLMPGGMFVAGILERLAPLNYWPVLIVLLALQFLATWTTYRLLRSLIGVRPGLLIPVAILTLTPMTLLPGAWFAAGINFLPMQIATATAGWALLRVRRGGSQGWSVLVAVVVAGSLLFFEKSVLIPLALVAIAIAGGPRGKSVGQLFIAALQRTWLTWVLLAPIIAVYLLIYFDRRTDVDSRLVDSAGIVLMLTDAVVKGLLPSLLGGPISWLPAGFGSAVVDPSTWVVVVGVTMVVALAVYGGIQSARSRAVWFIAGLYVLADLFILALGRGGSEIVLSLGLTLRYTVDSLVVILVAIAITLVPPSGEDESLPARQLRRRVTREMNQRAWVPIGAVVVAAALTSAAVSSHFNLIGPLSQNDSRPWLINVQRAAESAITPIKILDAPVPDAVLGNLNSPYNMYSWMLAPIGEKIEVTRVIREGIMFDEQGRLVSADVSGIDSFPGPNGDCGWLVTDEPVEIILGGEVIPWIHTMRLFYLAPENVIVSVSVGEGPSVPVELRKGTGAVYFLIEGGGSRVTITPTQSQIDVCISQARIGNLQPLP